MCPAKSSKSNTEYGNTAACVDPIDPEARLVMKSVSNVSESLKPGNCVASSSPL